MENNNLNLIDIGANLTAEQFRGKYQGKQKHIADLDDVLNRSWENHLSKIIITSGTFLETKKSYEMSLINDKLYTTLGVHPTRGNELDDVENMNQYLNYYNNINNKNKICAIGECGLDYDRLNFCSKDIQISSFLKHFQLANETNLPMFLHSRNCKDDFNRIMRENIHLIPQCGVVHSYTGEQDELDELLDLGLYIGINGCSLKSQDNINIMSNIPIERLMIETDAPWCSLKRTHASYQHISTFFPEKKKPEKWESGFLIKGRCEPCHIIQVLEVIASVKEIDMFDLADQIYQNTMNLFFSNEI